MRAVPVRLLLVLHLCNQLLVAAAEKTNLTIGFLTAMKGDLPDRQGLGISGAITMALDEVCICHFIQNIISEKTTALLLIVVHILKEGAN